MYMTEDICKGCAHAVFHACCQRFCRCKAHNETYRKYETGTCAFKLLGNENNAPEAMTEIKLLAESVMKSLECGQLDNVKILTESIIAQLALIVED